MRKHITWSSLVPIGYLNKCPYKKSHWLNLWSKNTLYSWQQRLYLHFLSLYFQLRVAATAAAKSLQSCPTLCDPIDGSPLGSSVPGILQARILEWVAISSPMHESEKWKGSRSVVPDSQWPNGLQPTRLLRPWDFPSNSTGVGCHCLLRNKCSINLWDGLMDGWLKPWGYFWFWKVWPSLSSPPETGRIGDLVFLLPGLYHTANFTWENSHTI